jgi:hypothetical protein
MERKSRQVRKQGQYVRLVETQCEGRPRSKKVDKEAKERLTEENDGFVRENPRLERRLLRSGSTERGVEMFLIECQSTLSRNRHLLNVLVVREDHYRRNKDKRGKARDLAVASFDNKTIGRICSSAISTRAS